MKLGLAIVATMSLLALSACDTAPSSGGLAIEAPIPTAATLADGGTLGDWSRAADAEKTDFLQDIATTRANLIMQDSPSTTADDAMAASLTYFRQCMDGFSYSGVDETATKVASMLVRCQARFDPADAQRFLNRVYQAKSAAGAQPQDVAWTTPPPEAPKKPEPEYPAPDFGE